MSGEDKLTDTEREALHEASRRAFKRASWAWLAVLGMAAAAIWTADWRFAGIAVVPAVVAVCFMAIGTYAVNERHEHHFAKRFRTRERAAREREERERRRVEDLERDLGMRP